MSTPRFEPDLIAVGPVYEPMCCPWHTDTCGLEDWCCDACSEAGLVVSTRRGGRVTAVARPTTSFPKDEAAHADDDPPGRPLSLPCTACGDLGWHFHPDGTFEPEAGL